MTSALSYDELDTNRVDTLFNENGVLLVELTTKHAKALIAFIDTLQVVKSWDSNRTPFLARLVPLVKGLLVIFRITVKHSRLFDLGHLIAINSASYTWEQLPDDQFMFTFRR